MFSLIALPVLGGVLPGAEAVVVIGGGILLMVLAGIGLGLASQKPSVRTSVSITGAIAVLLIILALLPLALCMGIMRGCDQAHPTSGQGPR
jgi:hypothetical protein